MSVCVWKWEIQTDMPTSPASVDVSNLMTRMSRYQSQFPFATAVALTQTAKDAQPAVRTAMQQVFDRPTAYTLNSTYITPAKKTDPVPFADVFFKNETTKGTPAAAYIYPEVYGGQRNRVHHNTATNNATFTELGNARSADNTFAASSVSLDRRLDIASNLADSARPRQSNSI